MNTFKINNIEFYFTKNDSKYNHFKSKEKIYVMNNFFQISIFFDGYFVKDSGGKIGCIVFCDLGLYKINKNQKFYCSTDYEYLVKKADSIKYLS
mgnify:CR=1 FL=1